MRFYPVVNLGQTARTFETIDDVTLSRICAAVRDFNEWKNWADTPTGDRHMRDAVANVQSMVNTIPKGIQPAAIQDIQNNCDDPEDLIGFLQLNLPGTPPMTTPGQAPVATTDRSREPEPPPPNTNPPVATGQPGPGRGAFRPLAPVATTGTVGPPYIPPTMEEPIPPTGSESPFEVSNRDENPPPPPPSMPAPVASVGSGCFYVPGKGYSWGPPPPDGQNTGLNQNDCESIRQRDLEVRGIPTENTQASQTSQVSNQQQTSEGLYNPNRPATPPPPPAPVATGGPAACDPSRGQFWDGRKCRGSVDMPSGGLLNTAFGGGGGGGGGGTVSPGNLDINPGTLTSASFGGMGRGLGRRSFPVVNL